MGKLRNILTKALRSLLLLVNWEIWKEMNARIFDRCESSTIALLTKIKQEAWAWGIAGARHLLSILGD